MYIPQSKFEYESNIQIYNIPNTPSLLKYRMKLKKIVLLNNAFLELSSLLSHPTQINNLISVFVQS